MSTGRLPGTDDERARERIVLHVDMDCFYASCERLREPELVGEPVVVGMGFEPGETHGAVATASYEAREFGVESAQPISEALEALPRIEDAADDPSLDATRAGHYRPVDIEFYQSVAAEVKAILHDCADVVREVSIDEAYLDVTERTGWQTVGGSGECDEIDAGDDADPNATGGQRAPRTLAEGYARHVKERIAREVGVPASVGVAPNMSAAKIASDHDKPDGLVVVRPGDVREFLAPLSVEVIHGVGPVTTRELAEMGVETAGDLAATDPTVLADRFGERGRALYRRARGNDDRPVEPTGRPKSLNREKAIPDPTDDTEQIRERVATLARDVAERARRRGAMYRTVGIKVVTPPYEVQTRARSLSGPVDDPDLVKRVALDLLTEFEGETVRKLGVRVSKFSFSDADQARLDGWEGAAERTDTANAGDTNSDGTSGDDERSRDEDPGDDEESTDPGTDEPEGQASLTDF